MPGHPRSHPPPPPVAASADLQAGLRHAVELLRAGRLSEAQAACGQVLAAHPRQFDALQLAGVVALQAGEPERGLGLLEQALAVDDKVAGAHANRGNALLALGRHDEAAAAFDRALALDPANAGWWSQRGRALRAAGRGDEALASLERAVALDPAAPDAWNNRGNALRALQRNDEAIASYDRALALAPGHAQAWSNRARALRDAGRPQEALASYDRAVALRPAHAELWTSRGNALAQLDRVDEAVASYDRALALQPTLAQAWHNRAEVLARADRQEEALASYAQALALEPAQPGLQGGWLLARLRLCDWDGLAAELVRLQEALAAGRPAAAPFVCAALLDAPQLLLQVARAHAQANHPQVGPRPAPRRRSAGERVRVGYFSADFHNHATAWLIAQMLESHDTARFELYGFSFGAARNDEMRRRTAAAFHRFLDVSGSADRDVAQLSRELGIDIAVDLKGYTQHSRTGIFAHGSAPIQVNYLGYPGTMGAGYIDYIVADRVVVPPGSERNFTEQVVRLPHCYQPNDACRAIAGERFTREASGLPASGFVFCCFNAAYKIQPAWFDGWARILGAVEGSVLWLLDGPPAAVRNLRRQAQARGIDPARLVFAPRLPHALHLARLRLADVFLDTLPCNAHTTASDALWAGLPLLTCTGSSFASRVAASLLHTLGLPELVTASAQAYEDAAIALATRPAALAALRERLAAARISSPLFDGRQHARHMEAAYLAMLARLDAGQPPAPLEVPALRQEPGRVSRPQRG